MAHADPILIRQVWTNLFSNAIKFTNKKMVAVITVSSKIQDENTLYVVNDNGAGFNMKDVDKLFGVFNRLHTVEQLKVQV